MSVKKIVSYFERVDPILHQEIAKMQSFEILVPAKEEEYCEKLCREIVFQQLSTKAGSIIWQRFKNLTAKANIQAGDVLSLSLEELRGVGLSNAKASYLHNIALAFESNNLPVKEFSKMSDEEVTASLISIKGVGQWTAEMFLISTLARNDIFSYSDAGLQRAVKNLYFGSLTPGKRQIEEVVRRWSPYRSYASLILWGSLN